MLCYLRAMTKMQYDEEFGLLASLLVMIGGVRWFDGILDRFFSGQTGFEGRKNKRKRESG